jgi:hypothetical protein
MVGLWMNWKVPSRIFLVVSMKQGEGSAGDFPKGNETAQLDTPLF